MKDLVSTNNGMQSMQLCAVQSMHFLTQAKSQAAVPSVMGHSIGGGLFSCSHLLRSRIHHTSEPLQLVPHLRGSLAKLSAEPLYAAALGPTEVHCNTLHSELLIH